MEAALNPPRIDKNTPIEGEGEILIGKLGSSENHIEAPPRTFILEYLTSEGSKRNHTTGVNKSDTLEIPADIIVGLLGIICAKEQRHRIALITAVAIPIQIIHSATVPAVSISLNEELPNLLEFCANSS
tara:strand:- start:3 stop:389 length:387 start_codon:yes stop_codon:yes gene_type:complete